MVNTKNSRNSSALQKYYPLNLVPIEEIPKAVDQDLKNQICSTDLLYLGSLMEILCVEKKGIGLSAFQVGIPLPFFIASVDGKIFTYYLDCEYTGQSDLADSIEGCLSLLDNFGQPKRYLLKRYKVIKCKGRKMDFKHGTEFAEFDETFDGLQAVVLQHEADHHLPRLISDIGEEVAVI